MKLTGADQCRPWTRVVTGLSAAPSSAPPSSVWLVTALLLRCFRVALLALLVCSNAPLACVVSSPPFLPNIVGSLCSCELCPQNPVATPFPRTGCLHWAGPIAGPSDPYVRVGLCEYHAKWRAVQRSRRDRPGRVPGHHAPRGPTTRCGVVIPVFV